MTSLLQIRPAAALPEHERNGLFLSSLENLVSDLLQEELSKFKEEFSLENLFALLESQLPLIKFSECKEFPAILSITLLCRSHVKFANGTGRFFLDTFERFALPGHYLGTVFTRSLDFFFVGNDEKQFFLYEMGFRIKNTSDYEIVKHNLPKLIQQTRIIIRAVFETRRIMSVKSLSSEEKNLLIQEKIASLVEKRSKEFDLNLFDEIQGLIQKLSAEEKKQQMKEIISPLVEKRPEMFDSETFLEMQNFLLLYRNKFTAVRELNHLSRIFCFHYLFRKKLQFVCQKESTKRHLYLKLFKGKALFKSQSEILGMIIAVNLLSHHELFEAKHIIQAVKSLIPSTQEIPSSYVVDQRIDNIRIFYIEFLKGEERFFSFEEIKKLKRELSKELKERFESVLHPIFMPRNEEEIFRHIVTLSNELVHEKDIPQAMIHFDKQTHNNLVFNVILLRLAKKNSLSLRTLFAAKESILKFQFERVQNVGSLTPRIQKEANVFQVVLPKQPFFRKDFSLDLQKARQRIFEEISKALGEVRDYNGGMIENQNKNFHAFKRLISELSNMNDFLVENFFYSIEPATMQSLLSPSLLKIAYLSLMKAFDYDFEHSPLYLSSHTENLTLLLVLASKASLNKDKIAESLRTLKVRSSEVAIAMLHANEIHGTVIFYHSRHSQKRKLFFEVISYQLEKAFLESHAMHSL